MKFQTLDGRHKLAIVGSLIAWGVSVFFSKEGFSIDAPNSAWLGWVLAGIVTIVELVFNSKTQKLSLTLIFVGIVCYLYGVWTNVTGFWEYQNPGIPFPWSQTAWLSMFVGFILEVLPEPLFMWGIGSAFEGDLLGNLAGLWKGDLGYAKPDSRNGGFQKTNNSSNPFVAPKSNYKPKHHPKSKPLFSDEMLHHSPKPDQKFHTPME